MALFRQALAPGTFDPPGMTLGGCSTQRNLNDEGRAQARRLGERFRRHGLRPAAIMARAGFPPRRPGPEWSAMAPPVKAKEASVGYTELSLMEQPAIELLEALGWTHGDLMNEVPARATPRAG